MVRKEIELFGRKLILHQRFASDVLAVLDMDIETSKDEIIVVLASVSAALKENWIYQDGKKKKELAKLQELEKMLSPAGLSTRLTTKELVALWNQVAELEGLDSGESGSKKK